jgi:hypothetical protein
MPQTLTSRAIAETSKVAQKELASEGFKRKSVHLLRESFDVLHCIHFQSSKWGTSEEGQFTVNFVVTWSSIYEAWTGKALPTNPATASYPIQCRIGSCLPARTDVWWTVSLQTDLDAAAQEVGNKVAQIAPAFFSRYPSTEAILTSIRVNGSLPGLTEAQACLVHAHLEQSAGRSVEAERTIATIWAEAGNSPFKSTIRSFAARANIPLPR